MLLMNLLITTEKNGGISRYEKLEHFLKNIYPKYSKGFNLNKDHLKSLLKNYSMACRLSLCNAQVTEGLSELREISGDITLVNCLRRRSKGTEGCF